MCLFSTSGGEITSTFDSPDTVKLGECDLIEEIMIGEDSLLKFSGEDHGQPYIQSDMNLVQLLLNNRKRSIYMFSMKIAFNSKDLI